MPNALGYKAWTGACGGRVRPCRDLAAAARVLLSARERGTSCRVVACATLTRDRELTGAEAKRLVKLATEGAT